MTNALARRASEMGVGNGGGGYLTPGNQRTVHDPKSGRTWTITRTQRAYAYDLADAYNDQLSNEQIDQGMKWIVYGLAGNEQIKLVTQDDAVTKSVEALKARNERDRLAFNARANFSPEGI